MKQESTQFLHNDKELFRQIVSEVHHVTKRKIPEIEKDYYVTMILKLLSESYDDVVFKGGTSLSKALKMIERFSEDIDITFTSRIGVGRRDVLKNETIKGISETLGLPITNFESTQSKHDLNAYFFKYEPISQSDDGSIVEGLVKMETALMSNAYPVKECEISSIIGDYLKSIGDDKTIKTFGLVPFAMKIQTIERTFIDKVFALCDYYLIGSTKRLSRHLYDLYMLYPHVDKNIVASLFQVIRDQRSAMKKCPSAKISVSIHKTIIDFIQNDYYKKDYEDNGLTLIYGEKVPYNQIKAFFFELAEFVKNCLEKN